MRCTSLVMCDPANAEQAASLRKVVDAYLAKYPDARLTWLQSAATYQLWESSHGTGGAYVMYANHLLTCAIEYEGTIGAKLATPVPVKPGAQVLRNPKRR